MDQNQTLDNQVLDQTTDNDLQRAIDNITNTTNVDPVFSDPVAAPSSVPEGDTGELAESVGPFPEPKIEMVAPAPEPMAPLDGINIPDLTVPAAPVPEPLPMPEPAPMLAPEPAPMPAPAPVVAPAPMPEPMPAPAIETAPQPVAGLNTHQVKEAALRDLMPLLDHLSMTPSQKFNFYRNIFEQLKDYTVLDRAYHAAAEIPDEKERAEALLYLVESIDKM